MWPWRRRAARREQARTAIEGLRTELQRARHDLHRVDVELQLTRQARDKAEGDATYWRQRAERFLDQIALRAGMLSEPAMTEPPPNLLSQADTIFGALGQTAINQDNGPMASAAPAAPRVTGVDVTAARELIDDTLAGIRA